MIHFDQLNMDMDIIGCVYDVRSTLTYVLPVHSDSCHCIEDLAKLVSFVWLCNTCRVNKSLDIPA